MMGLPMLIKNLFERDISRAINGVVKAHSSGAIVAIYRPGIWAIDGTVEVL